MKLDSIMREQKLIEQVQRLEIELLHERYPRLREAVEINRRNPAKAWALRILGLDKP